jgi:hypothetical protein
MFPTDTIIQYCSKIRGLSTKLGRLGQPISEPLLRLLVIHGLTPKFADFASQVAMGVIDVVHGFNNWDAFVRRLRYYAAHLNIRPSPSTATSADIDPSDLIWLGQPGLDKNQANFLMTMFTCPIHRSNDDTLERCGAVKRLFTVSSNTNSAPSGSTGRGSGTRGSDGGRGRGRGYQRRSDNDSNTDATPSQPPPVFLKTVDETQYGGPSLCPICDTSSNFNTSGFSSSSPDPPLAPDSQQVSLTINLQPWPHLPRCSTLRLAAPQSRQQQ